jgi:hypothetical protein
MSRPINKTRNLDGIVGRCASCKEVIVIDFDPRTRSMLEALDYGLTLHGIPKGESVTGGGHDPDCSRAKEQSDG